MALISHSTLRARRATFTFLGGQKFTKMPKIVNFDYVLKTSSLRSNRVTKQVFFNLVEIQMINIWVICGHTVLPDKSILIGQKLAENANIQM